MKYNISCELSLYEKYKKELKRISWRLQYKERVKRQKEILIDKDIKYFVERDKWREIEMNIYIKELLKGLSSDRGRFIIEEVYLKDQRESDVALLLNISQQGVNKWKRKMLNELQMMNLE